LGTGHKAHPLTLGICAHIDQYGFFGLDPLPSQGWTDVTCITIGSLDAGQGRIRGIHDAFENFSTDFIS
jgi:hypothetical protein